jgi:putative FmdB family regulatory protein
VPIYDFECEYCGHQFDLLVGYDVNKVKCLSCNKEAKRVFPKKAPGIDLKYNPVTDMVDWDGNTTRYWDEYKKQKSEGKDVRIPKHDGDAK